MGGVAAWMTARWPTPPGECAGHCQTSHAVHPVSCPDDRARHRKLMHGIEGALIG
jgi:hypothetical protein